MAFTISESNLTPVTVVTCDLALFHRKMLIRTLLYLWGMIMGSKLLLCVVLALAPSAYAKEPKAHQSGELLQMDSVPCGTSEKDGQNLAGEMPASDSIRRKAHEVLCPEYVLQAERVLYRIRPRDEKHPVLLPVGDRAQFRLEKDKMLLEVEDLDNKEREYSVVSMTPRSDSSTAEAATPRLNHLQ